jgi:FemAB-related protein (PEP-CTERM system-associated)
MALKIRHLTDAKYDEWDAFVFANSGATFFHRAGWKTVLERSFGHKTCFLYAEREGQIQGILPLGHIKSALFGNNLVSAPFCVYGGVVATSREVEDKLYESACSLARDLKVDALEMRSRVPTGRGWPTKNLYVTFRKSIDPDSEVNMKAIPRKQRAMVRKGIQAGLKSEWDDGWERVYRTYSESVRNLGTPVFPAKFFRTLRDVFENDCRVLMVRYGDKDVAGVMSFYFKDEVLPYYGGSIPLARSVKGNDFMYWEMIRRSGEEGIRVFDYGRSKEGTGSYSFKKNWGFTPEPLFYEYHLVGADKIPEINPMNPKYQLFINAWKKLPLPIANRLGPILAKNLG